MIQFITIIAVCLSGFSKQHSQEAVQALHIRLAAAICTPTSFTSSLLQIRNPQPATEIYCTPQGSETLAGFFSSRQHREHTLKLLAAFAIAAIFLASRRRKNKAGNFVDVMLVADSSSQTMAPDAEALIALYSYHLDLDQKGTLRKNVISGSRIPCPVEATICDWERSVRQNTDKRVDFRFKQIDAFFNGIRNIVGEQQNDNGSTSGQHQVFRTIAGDLNIFSNGSATEQIMVIHSGLREQSNIFSCTSDADLQLLYSSPKKIAARFKGAVKIGKLKKVKVVFVYAPADEPDEIFFLQMVYVYRLVLAHSGAVISIQSDNKKYCI